MLRDFALVVMVMPCGLTPVEGIDFVDWFTSPCMHVLICGPHKHTHAHTHTDQCTVWCLWRMGVAYWTSASASKEHCHAQKNTWAPWKQDGKAFNSWVATGWTHWMFFFVLFFFLIANDITHSLQISLQSAGCERETSKLSTGQRRHVISVFFMWFMLLF